MKCYGYGVEADEPGVRDQCAGGARHALDATPLADELHTLRARVKELEAGVEYADGLIAYANESEKRPRLRLHDFVRRLRR